MLKLLCNENFNNDIMRGMLQSDRGFLRKSRTIPGRESSMLQLTDVNSHSYQAVMGRPRHPSSMRSRWVGLLPFLRAIAGADSSALKALGKDASSVFTRRPATRSSTRGDFDEMWTCVRIVRQETATRRAKHERM